MIIQSLQLEKEKNVENYWHCYVALNIIIIYIYIFIYNTTALFLKIKQLYNCWLKMNFNKRIDNNNSFINEETILNHNNNNNYYCM